MNCRKWEERIALYVEGDLLVAEVPETERHVAECAECSRFAEGLKQDLAMLRDAHAEAILPAHVAAVRARVLEQVQGERRTARRVAWIGGLIAASIGAAALAAMLLAPRPVEPLRIAVAPPAAPELQVPVRAPAQAVAPKRAPRVRPEPRVQPSSEPLLVKLITDDPDVVIYWIAN